jgi:hypothetical protein
VLGAKWLRGLSGSIGAKFVLIFSHQCNSSSKRSAGDTNSSYPATSRFKSILQSFRNLSLLTPKLQTRILLLRMVQIRLVFLTFLAGAPFLNAQYEYDLLTEAPNIQTAFWPALFRRACPSGYVSHLCNEPLAAPLCLFNY